MTQYQIPDDKGGIAYMEAPSYYGDLDRDIAELISKVIPELMAQDLVSVMDISRVVNGETKPLYCDRVEPEKEAEMKFDFEIETIHVEAEPRLIPAEWSYELEGVSPMMGPSDLVFAFKAASKQEEKIDYLAAVKEVIGR